MGTAERPVVWVGSSRSDVRRFPREVRRDLGRALYAAQQGEIDPAAKPLRGFGGGSVLEIVASHRGDTWRAVYTVRYAEAIYVLHAFQKKSKERHRHSEKRYGACAATARRGRAASPGKAKLNAQKNEEARRSKYQDGKEQRKCFC